MSEEQVSRGDIFLVALNPTRGSEIRKTKPCVVVSPDELNDHLRTFIVAPLTTGGHPYPFRVPCNFDGMEGHVVPDQLRAVDRDSLIKRLGDCRRLRLLSCWVSFRRCLLCRGLAEQHQHHPLASAGIRRPFSCRFFGRTDPTSCPGSG